MLSKRYGSFRWILLTAGVIAILGLTGMNVYSLYALQENTRESARENKKLQIAEFADKIRYRFYKQLDGLGSTNIHRLKDRFQQEGQFTSEVIELLDKAAADSIYSGIYFIPSESDVCRKEGPILKYKSSEGFIDSTYYGDVVCDGMGIARTQMKSLINEYRFNNKVLFDTHRSITITLVDPSKKSIFGYLTMPFNQDFLRNTYLPRVLSEKFGVQTGMNVWLRDWTNNEIIASSNPGASYDRENIQFEQNFPDFFDYWKMEVAFTNTAIAASNSSLIKNLVVLAAAMLLLLGALLFMFISAQKERALAERQADFLANVTHELKTPLSVMQAAGENLADGRVKSQSRLKSYGTHIFKEAVRLRRMIEKLLDVAKANAGQSLINPEPANIKELVSSFLDDQREFIKNKGFVMQTNIADEVPPVMLDIDNFNTILNNLVENAIKYSDDEKYLGITLDCTEKNVELRVEDHGVGMTKKNISNIFNKFFRAEDSLTAKTKGHGLGLSIVKNLVEINGGEIHVESEPGKGSVFTVKFPILIETARESSQGSGTSVPEVKSESIIEESKKYGS